MKDLTEKFSRVKLLALDSDGVLTDGGVMIFADGSEFRRFDIKDGMGLRRLLEQEIQIVIISSSTNQAVIHRAKKLGIQHIYTGVENKLNCLQKVCQELGFDLESVCYMGDDLPDLPVMKAVGLSCAPADAIEAVLAAAAYVCLHKGGHGAVREVCDHLFRSQGKNSPSGILK
jgi:3-deoxy-D-manno-octulosonate 8-phosphate phosphatase (KDO 8-P phosphatase)